MPEQTGTLIAFFRGNRVIRLDHLRRALMDLLSGCYYAVHFENIANAVDYCGEMVPHVVKRLRSGRGDGIDAPAIWFHTLPRAAESSVGCDLLMTRSAILAALEGGMRIPSVGPSMRTALPAGAVLVLGEDMRQAPVRKRGPRPADTEKILEQVIQLSA